jgi:hypothetical protein
MDHKKNLAQVLFFLGQRNINFKIVYFGTNCDINFTQEIVDLVSKEATKNTEQCMKEFAYIMPE